MKCHLLRENCVMRAPVQEVEGRSFVQEYIVKSDRPSTWFLESLVASVLHGWSRRAGSGLQCPCLH